MSNLPGASLGQSGFQCITPGTLQTVAFTGTSAQSSAFQGSTNIIRVCASQDCFILFGASPTATTSSIFMPAGVVEYFSVTPGQKVAAIQSSVAGTLYIAEAA